MKNNGIYKVALIMSLIMLLLSIFTFSTMFIENTDINACAEDNSSEDSNPLAANNAFNSLEDEEVEMAYAVVITIVIIISIVSLFIYILKRSRYGQ